MVTINGLVEGNLPQWSIRSSWLHPPMPLVLSILAHGESYGYEMIQRVRELSGGEIAWTDGMLYPVLRRLESQGQIESELRTAETGRQRRYYRISSLGHTELRSKRAQ